MKRFLALGAGVMLPSVILLGGCALPLPVQVASWALDGISYLATEKSVADHGISLLAHKDCAVLRGLVNDGEFCRDLEDGETLIAFAGLDVPEPDEAAAASGVLALDDGALTNARPIITGEIETAAAQVSALATFDAGDPLASYPTEIGGVAAVTAEYPNDYFVAAAESDGADILAGFETAAGEAAPVSELVPESVPEPVEVALAATSAVDGDFALPGEGAPAAALVGIGDWRAETLRPADAGREPPAGLYFVIGSFREHGNARRLRRAHRSLTPSVLAAKLDTGMVFRVVVGPFDQDQAKTVHQRIYDAGISDSWAIRVRPGEWSMAVVDPPAEAPRVAQLDDGGWTAMRVIEFLARLVL